MTITTTMSMDEDLPIDSYWQRVAATTHQSLPAYVLTVSCFTDYALREHVLMIYGYD